MKKNEKPIIVEETFPHDIWSVWKAITDPEDMRKWFFDSMPDFKPLAGFEVEFNVESESRDFLHQWRVTRVIPMEIIEYNWKYGGYQGDSFVRFELSNEDGSTRLRLTHTVLENFDEDVPEFSRESCLGGWRHFIQNRLKDFLN